MEKTVHLKISGRVQGVWYRAWTRETAVALNLNGWVRNRIDGSVEALVHGDETAINDLIRQCWSGPAAARVDDIEVTSSTETVTPGFRQEQTL